MTMQTMKGDSSVKSGILSFLAFVLILVVGVIINGFVLAMLWGWFVVPVFDVPIITISQAVGLSFVISFIRYKQFPKLESLKQFTAEWWAFILSETLFRPLWMLFLSWICYLIIG